MPAWPGTLPDFVLREGYEEGFKNLAIRSQMDSGAAKRRKRFSGGPSKNTFPIEVTSAQLDIFKTFFEDTIGGGALSFTKTHPRTSATETYAFLSTPDPATPSGYNTYIILMKLEQLP